MQGTIERGVYGTATEILELANNVTAVVYQDAAVVKFNDNRIVLTAPDAAKSQTTKLRMNQASYQFGLGYYVVKRRNRWYVYKSTIDANGKLQPTEKVADFTSYKIELDRSIFA